MARRNQRGLDAMTALLDAAERLFARDGYYAVTIRAITKEAGVRLASAHYYFESKQRLYEAVIERRAVELRAARRAMLELVDFEGPPRQTFTAIARAYVEPIAFRVNCDAGWKRSAYIDAQNVLWIDGDRMSAPYTDPCGRMLVHALGPSGAGMETRDAAYGALFAIGAAARVLAGWKRFERLAPGQLDSFALPLVSKALVAFVAAGWERMAAGDAPSQARQIVAEDASTYHPDPDPPTQDRILNAAEELFAGSGFHGVTIRQITQRADVSSAHAHYYFGSKDALFRAVVARRSGPINKDRNAALNMLAFSGHEGEDCVGVFDAFLRPFMARLLFQGPEWRSYANTIIPAANTEDDYWLESVRELDLVVLRVARMLEGVEPRISRAAALLTVLLMLGPSLIGLSPGEKLRRISDGVADSRDLQALYAQLMTFLAGAAPAARSGLVRHAPFVESHKAS